MADYILANFSSKCYCRLQVQQVNVDETDYSDSGFTTANKPLNA